MQTFDLTKALPERTTSTNTQRAYYRWVDRYLTDVAGLKSTHGDERLKRMENLPMKSLQRHLTARKLKNWLNRLVEDGQGRQALDQARATIVTLADLLAEHDLIEAELADQIHQVSVPPVEKKTTPERLLTAEEVKLLMSAARDMATSKQQRLRNDVVATMLCTMALRRDELSAAKWSDLSVQDDQRVMLQINTVDYVDVPRPVLRIVDRWRGVLGTPEGHTPLIRRIWKGGRVAKAGLSSDGIWLIIRNAAQYANLGHVTPDDLRRSAVANMHQAGMPIEEISRLLRHRNLLITERFLSRLQSSEADLDEP